ncbi:cytochrome c oxidase assembly protein [Roseateles asaccharophilus]|uniref:Cytochrome c oxidase assembly protein CtaG n=1 Tax=Roseateles asaccharophilus TaxID=582607 RepID=A0ABU2AE87_9BURK|nr:cytochrome c oxidase assembly protein [Roseateles asaccharophilus]MDR7334903.1 cytochrome c oxidase assembly protein subunit 11 [Roseateles asaccharophilus]
MRFSALHRDNRQLLLKLVVVVVLMLGFGYALVPLYKHICEALGINVLSLSERQTAAAKSNVSGNGQVDYSREITVEFDTNARGPWDFKPAVRHMTVHPGELSQVMYEFRNKQDRTMAAQAIPSYAPMQASAHFNKLECFCFNEYTLKPGETKQWPVVFVIDPKLPKDVKTITLSYTFFEVAGKGVVKVGQAPTAGAAL